MTRRREHFFLIAVLLVTFVVVLGMSFPFFTKGYFPITDSIQNFLFSDTFAETGDFVYHNPFNETYDPDVFGPRGIVIRPDGSAVPTSILGYIVLLGAVKMVAPALVILLNPLLAVMAVYFVYALARRFVGPGVALFGAAIYMFSAAFLFVASIPMNNLAATAFFLGTVYAILRGIETKRWYWFALAGFLAGACLWTRYIDIWFLVPTILFFFFRETRPTWKNIIAVFVPFAALFGLLWMVNVHLYGSLLGFINPDGILNRYESVTRVSTTDSLFGALFYWKNIGTVVSNFYHHVLRINPFIIVGAAFGIFYFFVTTQTKKMRISVIYLLAIVFLQFVFYLSRNWSGVFLVDSVGTSFARYMLPTFALLLVLSLPLFQWLLNRFRRMILLIVPLAFSAYLLHQVSMAIYSDFAYRDFQNTLQLSTEIQQELADHTASNSVIITTYGDKQIFPTRMPLVHTAIPEGERFDVLADLIRTLESDGVDVYIYREGGGDNAYWDQRFAPYRERGLQVERAFNYMYLITTEHTPT